MNVVVAGSGGFIGQALVAELESQGHHAVRLVRPGSPERGAATRLVHWDPGAGTIDREALATHGPIGAVVNLAGAGIGERRWTSSRRAEIRESRVNATKVLVDAMSTLDFVPPVLVNASAIGYYGDRGDEPLSEQSPPGLGYLAEVCRRWEAEATKATTHGVRVVLLRTGVVLAPHGGALARQVPLFRVGLGGPLGNGRQYVSWISLPDEVAVITRALRDSDLSGPVNATAPHPLRASDLSRALGRALHRPCALHVPRLALTVALGAGLTREALLASTRALPQVLLDAGHHFVHPDIDSALADLLRR